MKLSKLKKQVVIVLACSLIIVILAGHGIGFMPFIEFAFVNRPSSYPFSLMPKSYDESLGAAALFFLVGHSMLIVSLFIKHGLAFQRLLVTGLIFLLSGFIYLTHLVFSGNTLSIISLVSGIPFIATSVVLIFKILVFIKVKS